MNKKLLIRDLTLRDGQQSAFATRMSQAQVDRVLPYYKDANFYAMEVWGGAVPDSVMRYLGENPWNRLEKISEAVGKNSKLTALSRGRNLYGYAPYPDEIIDGFFKNAVDSGLNIMRIFDALNDVTNIRSSVKYIKQYGGLADCAVCYTVDSKPTSDKDESNKKTKKRLFSFLGGDRNKNSTEQPKPVFTDSYFLSKAQEMVALGADMITIKDMSGLIPPSRVASLVSLFKKELNVPIDFHTHCTPGYGLASVVTAIIHGADIVDTNIWYFAGGPAAPAVELIYVFCKKLGIDLDINMEAVAKINEELYSIRKELSQFDTTKQFPKPFNPLIDILPEEIDKQFDIAIKAIEKEDEVTLLDACHKIHSYFEFPQPNELVKNAEIPGGMYTNMVAQLKQLNSIDILEDAMRLIPSVRADAGLPPLVTPSSQIVGVQAVVSAMNLKKGNPKYSNPSNQFIALVKGQYGKTPVPVDPSFREQITGSPEEIPYNTQDYKYQDNPVLPEYGNVNLAKTEKEKLLLELFPSVAFGFLKDLREQEFNSTNGKDGTDKDSISDNNDDVIHDEITGNVISSPMPGNIFQILVKEGDMVSKNSVVIILEAMKMENEIYSPFSGKVKRIFVKPNDRVMEDDILIEIV